MGALELVAFLVICYAAASWDHPHPTTLVAISAGAVALRTLGLLDRPAPPMAARRPPAVLLRHAASERSVPAACTSVVEREPGGGRPSLRGRELDHDGWPAVERHRERQRREHLKGALIGARDLRLRDSLGVIRGILNGKRHRFRFANRERLEGDDLPPSPSAAEGGKRRDRTSRCTRCRGKATGQLPIQGSKRVARAWRRG